MVVLLGGWERGRIGGCDLKAGAGRAVTTG